MVATAKWTILSAILDGAIQLDEQFVLLFEFGVTTLSSMFETTAVLSSCHYQAKFIWDWHGSSTTFGTGLSHLIQHSPTSCAQFDPKQVSGYNTPRSISVYQVQVQLTIIDIRGRLTVGNSTNKIDINCKKHWTQDWSLRYSIVKGKISETESLYRTLWYLLDR